MSANSAVLEKEEDTGVNENDFRELKRRAESYKNDYHLYVDPAIYFDVFSITQSLLNSMKPIERVHLLDHCEWQEKKIIEAKAKVVIEEKTSDKKLQTEFERRSLYMRAKEKRSKIEYSDELATEICERLSCGELISDICSEEKMPLWPTVASWLVSRPSFNTAFNAAKMAACPIMEDDILRIADDTSQDWIEKIDKRSGEIIKVPNAELITRSKVRIDTRLKLLKATNPTKWGDSPDLSQALKDRAQPTKVIINFISPSLPPQDLAIQQPMKNVEQMIEGDFVRVANG